MSTPMTYVKPWSQDQDPVKRELWAQFAGMYHAKDGDEEPAYSYYLNTSASPVTGLLGANGGLVMPETGLDRGVGPPRSGVVPPMPKEPIGLPHKCDPDQIEPGFSFEYVPAVERPDRPQPKG
jgi:hypothetical protein